MVNVIELENRWKKYKIRSYIPHIVILISVSVILIILVFILNNDLFDSKTKISSTEIKHVTPLAKKEENIKEPEVVKPVEVVTEQKSVKVIPEKQEPKRVQVTQNVKEDIKQTELSQKEPQSVLEKENRVDEEETKMLLTPSMGFVEKLKAKSSKENKSSFEDIHYNGHKTQDLKNVEKQKRPQNSTVPAETNDKTSSINIKRQSTNDDINHVIARFKKSNNPALSLFVAKKYYELGEYDRSYNYALITNEINSNIEASWLIFAKALVKLNKKDKAVQTLSQYIRHSNSNRAKILLDEIVSGKFK